MLKEEKKGKKGEEKTLTKCRLLTDHPIHKSIAAIAEKANY